MKSIKLHNAAIFALEIEGNWLFSGGWDKSIYVQVFHSSYVKHKLQNEHEDLYDIFDTLQI